MDHARPQHAQQSKASSTWHWDSCSDEPVDKKPTDMSPTQDGKRPFRRVRSPTRPRAWLDNSYKPKFGGRVHSQRNDPSSHKPGFGNQQHDHFSPRRAHWDRRGHFQPRLHHNAPREMETGRHEGRGSAEGCSPAKQNSTSRPFVPKSTSSRDKDTQFPVCQNDRKQSGGGGGGGREKDHRGTKSREREESRDRELPLTVSQTTTRDRAIQRKRREIDEVYYQECEMFGLVTKMLIEKDLSLERLIQSSLQENLRDIGKRCVEAMEKFIENYDSRELSH